MYLECFDILPFLLIMLMAQGEEAICQREPSFFFSVGKRTLMGGHDRFEDVTPTQGFGQDR